MPISVRNRTITVEPVMFLVAFAYILGNRTNQEFFYYSSCMDKYNSKEICIELDINKDLQAQEIDVQNAAAQFGINYILATVLPGLVTGLYLGVWLDSFSYKLAILIPIFGQMIIQASLLVVAEWNLPLNWILLGGGIGALGGNIRVLFQGLFSYMASDRVVAPEDRARRMGLLNGSFSLGTLSANFLSGFIIGKQNFYTAYFVTTGAYLIAIFYTILLVPELHTNEEISERKGERGWVSWLCSPRPLYEAFVTTFRPRKETHARKHLLMMIAVIVVYVTGFNCFESLLYLFYAAAPMSLTYVQFGLYTALDSVFGLFGNTIMIHIVTRWLHAADSTVALLGAIGWVGFFATVSPHTIYFALAALPFRIFQSFPSSGGRTLISKLVGPTESGKVFSLIALIDSLVQVIGALTLIPLYKNTLEVFRGWTFLMAAAITLISVFLLLVVKCDRTRTGQGSAPAKAPPTVCVQDE